MNKLIKYPVDEKDFFDQFREALYDTELTYNCHDLLVAGIDSEPEMRIAILKSIQLIKRAGLVPKQHFKHCFVTSVESGKIYNDWRISRMGFLLTLLHAADDNPLLDKWRIEIVRSIK